MLAHPPLAASGNFQEAVATCIRVELTAGDYAALGKHPSAGPVMSASTYERWT